MRKIEEYANYCYYNDGNMPQIDEEQIPEDETDKFLLDFLRRDCDQLYRCDALKAFSTIPLCEDCPHKEES